MTVAAVIFLAALLVFVCGIAFSPGHTFKGTPAVLTFVAFVASGVALSIGALT